MRNLVFPVLLLVLLAGCQTEQAGDIPTTKKIVEESKTPKPPKEDPKPVLEPLNSIYKADKTMGKRAPFGTVHQTVPYERTFTKTEYSQLQLGLAPNNEWDRWFILFSNDTLSFYRENTRYCLYQVITEPSADGGRVVSAKVNKNEKQFYNREKEFDLALLSYLFERILLGHEAECPIPEGTKPEAVEQTILAISGYGRANNQTLTWPNGMPEKADG